MGKWTQEPWKVVPGWRKHDFGICGDYHRNENGGQSCVHIIDVLGNETSGKIPSENADRAVACVNAMQGIPDPAKFVRACEELAPWVSASLDSGPCCDEYNKAVHDFLEALAAKPEEA